MDNIIKIPPQSANLLTTPDKLVKILAKLIGENFVLTGKTRTDGSNVRKLISATLNNYGLPPQGEIDTFEIIPPKSKGIPKITREFIDTYIITTGKSYNLQVWNRYPSSNTLLIKYDSGESLKCSDTRFVFVKINCVNNFIEAIIILTPEYIEQHFGKFGKPTIKHQLLISKKIRNSILNSSDKVLLYPDSNNISNYICTEYTHPKSIMIKAPKIQEVFSTNLLKTMVADKLIGKELKATATKNRGQLLERMVLELLGYKVSEEDLLFGAFPDIKHQLLEVKIQDSPTVDLGKYTPERAEIVIEETEITTFDIRYLIALSDSKTNTIEGIIIAPGEHLGNIFSYVSSSSYKCQRTIPMSFFEKHIGQVVFNPE